MGGHWGIIAILWSSQKQNASVFLTEGTGREETYWKQGVEYLATQMESLLNP
jgi:hypothetical protein